MPRDLLFKCGDELKLLIKQFGWPEKLGSSFVPSRSPTAGIESWWKWWQNGQSVHCGIGRLGLITGPFYGSGSSYAKWW